MQSYSSSLFDWTKEERCFSTEISRLNTESLADFIDESYYGFSMKSDVTGREVKFHLFHVQWTKQPRVAAWYLKPHKSEVQQDPRLMDVVCIVYNT